MFTHGPWLLFKSPSTCLVKPLSIGVCLGSWGRPRAIQDKPRALPSAAVLGSIFNIYPSFSRKESVRGVENLWGEKDSLWMRRVRNSWLSPLSRPTLLLASQECHGRFCKEKKKKGSEVKASASNAVDPGSIPGSGRSPGEGNGNPLQYSCLENSMDGEAW